MIIAIDKIKIALNYQYSARQATDIERQHSQLKQNAMWGGIFVIITFAISRSKTYFHIVKCRLKHYKYALLLAKY